MVLIIDWHNIHRTYYTQRKTLAIHVSRDNEIKEQLQTYLVFGNETECMPRGEILDLFEGESERPRESERTQSDVK